MIDTLNMAAWPYPNVEQLNQFLHSLMQETHLDSDIKLLKYENFWQIWLSLNVYFKMLLFYNLRKPLMQKSLSFILLKKGILEKVKLSATFSISKQWERQVAHILSNEIFLQTTKLHTWSYSSERSLLKYSAKLYILDIVYKRMVTLGRHNRLSRAKIFHGSTKQKVLFSMGNNSWN